MVASIHQPRSSIFAMFDDLVLLSEGEIVYCGDAAAVGGPGEGNNGREDGLYKPLEVWQHPSRIAHMAKWNGPML